MSFLLWIDTSLNYTAFALKEWDHRPNAASQRYFWSTSGSFSEIQLKRIVEAIESYSGHHHISLLYIFIGENTQELTYNNKHIYCFTFYINIYITLNSRIEPLEKVLTFHWKYLCVHFLNRESFHFIPFISLSYS